MCVDDTRGLMSRPEASRDFDTRGGLATAQVGRAATSPELGPRGEEPWSHPTTHTTWAPPGQVESTLDM